MEAVKKRMQAEVTKVVAQVTGPPALTRRQRQQVQVVVERLELLLDGEEVYELPTLLNRHNFSE